ncbi:hypothetical protein GCM10009839_65260 [Catenulispora yoronensis]|uniref:Uncharacterized protein n=1 Tax=Catenulispora yoronensis TaxID=450799 RepID=A0ABN2V405_9ACTN
MKKLRKLGALAVSIVGFSLAAALAWNPATAQAAGADTTFTAIPPVDTGTVNLTAVSMKSATDAWTVGVKYLNANTVIATLAERWNGTRWQVTPTPSPTGNADVLNGVADVSPANAWSVGYSENTAGTYTALIEHWNGTRWSQVPGGTAATSSNETLNAVTAVSATDVWAVGEHFDSTVGGFVGLLEHFDGTAWHIVPSPITYTSNGIDHGIPSFNAVVATSSSDVWTASNSGVQTAVVEHWNGTAWSVVPTPPLAVLNGQAVNTVAVVGLAATSAGDVWAVGGTTGFGRHAPHNQLVEHWDGASWSLVPAPADAATPLGLSGVAALSAGDAWALGFQPGTANPAFEHWDGTAWSNVAEPGVSGVLSELVSAPGGALLALGSTQAFLSTNG